MTIRELIAKLEAYPLDTEVYDIGEDRGHGYSREVVSPIEGIKLMAHPDGIVFTITDDSAAEHKAKKAKKVQEAIDRINRQRKGL